MRKQRRKFSRDYKLAAVKMVLENGLSYSAVARDLGVRDTMIRNWRKAFEQDGTLQADGELRQLREEIQRLKREHEVLKKATEFFAREAARS